MAAPVFSPPVKPTSSVDKPEFKILESDFGDGYTRPVPDGMNSIRRVVNLTWDFLTAAQADAIENFIRARGGADPFLYTLADTSTPLKWTCRELQRTRGTPNKIDLTLRQSFVFV